MVGYNCNICSHGDLTWLPSDQISLCTLVPLHFQKWTNLLEEWYSQSNALSTSFYSKTKSRISSIIEALLGEFCSSYPFGNHPFLTAHCSLRKKVEPKWLHPWSRFMVRNSAPPVALFWSHLQRWSCFCLFERSLKWICFQPIFLQIWFWKNGATSEGGAIFS